MFARLRLFADRQARSISINKKSWAQVDSNHSPPRYQHGALPDELWAQWLSLAEFTIAGPLAKQCSVSIDWEIDKPPEKIFEPSHFEKLNLLFSNN